MRRHFAGALKGPFNVADRARAGLSPDFYESLSGQWGMQSTAGEEVPPAALAFQGEKERALDLVEEEGQAKTAVTYDV